MLSFSKISFTILLATAIGVVVGSVGALFLIVLDYFTQVREEHIQLVWLLPLAGIFIAYTYKRYGSVASKGNNVLLSAYYQPSKPVPLIMAPLVLVGTWLTHLFGGSAGREGTAVQMGGAIATYFSRRVQQDFIDKPLIIHLGTAAGFAAVFGTPLAATVFALEVVGLKKSKLKQLPLTLLTAYIAYFTCEIWPAHHTDYSFEVLDTYHAKNIVLAGAVGIFFGLAALLFSKFYHVFSYGFNQIKQPLARPFLGGLVIALSIFFFETQKYLGLGIPTIIDSFYTVQTAEVWLLKLLYTTFTLGAGFKGGEVTPLFFIGATLGNFLSGYIPLTLSLLAALGFIGVFSGATNTPLACTFMGYELFGIEGVPFFAVCCFVAYLTSGKNGIYKSQAQDGLKDKLYTKIGLHRVFKVEKES
ncbi:MAG: chloride channel protein [Luteibaculaceae bacterium]